MNESTKGISQEAFERQRSRSVAFHRSIGIEIEEVEDNQILVRQTSLVDGHIRTNKELYDIGRHWYPDKAYKIVAGTYRLPLEDITGEWIREQMEIYGIKPKDVIRQTGLTQSEISLFLSGKRNMTRAIRALFYYYFLTYRLNRDLRRPPISAEELSDAIKMIQQKRASDQVDQE